MIIWKHGNSKHATGSTEVRRSVASHNTRLPKGYTTNSLLETIRETTAGTILLKHSTESSRVVQGKRKVITDVNEANGPKNVN